MNGIGSPSLISHFLTFVVFAYVGFRVSKKMHPPRGIASSVLLVAATVFSYFIGAQVELIGIDFAGIYLNTLLAGTGIGLIIGFLAKEERNPAPSTGS